MLNTKIKKIFIFIIAVTICTLFYVHQNIEILKIGYSINNNQQTLSYFLDQHRRLLYNLNKLKSPLALDTRLLADSIELVEPGTSNIYYASIKRDEQYLSSGFIKIRNKGIIDRLSDMLTEKAEAKAR